MTTYCAPCLADLALVREAATSVNGTASCMAHAVLLTHPGDDPQRRRQRLAQLRDTATEKMATAGSEEQMRLEVLVEEYSLASAMESLVPRRRPEEGGPLSRSARKRRGRDGRERPEGQGRPERPRGERGPGSQVSSAVADGGAEQAGAAALEQVGAPSGAPPAAVPAQDNAPAEASPAPLSMAGEPAPEKPVESAPPPPPPPPAPAAPPAVDGAVASPPRAPAASDDTPGG